MSRQECGNCGEPLTPRGGLPPKFCPRCGRRVSPAAVSAQLRGTSNGRRVCSGAVISLLLGFVSLLPVCAPAGLAAILVGVLARASVQESPDRLSGDGLAVGGIVLGILGSGIWLMVCTTVC